MNLRPMGYEPTELPDCSTPQPSSEDYRVANNLLQDNECLIGPKTNGAEGETRTRTDISPLPPQGSVSTSFTTSAKESDDFYNSGIESSLDSISSSSRPELSFDKGKSIASLLPRSTLICGIPSVSTLATLSLAK